MPELSDSIGLFSLIFSSDFVGRGGGSLREVCINFILGMHCFNKGQ